MPSPDTVPTLIRLKNTGDPSGRDDASTVLSVRLPKGRDGRGNRESHAFHQNVRVLVRKLCMYGSTVAGPGQVDQLGAASTFNATHARSVITVLVRWSLTGLVVGEGEGNGSSLLKFVGGTNGSWRGRNLSRSLSGHGRTSPAAFQTPGRESSKLLRQNADSSLGFSSLRRPTNEWRGSAGTCGLAIWLTDPSDSASSGPSPGLARHAPATLCTRSVSRNDEKV